MYRRRPTGSSTLFGPVVVWASLFGLSLNRASNSSVAPAGSFPSTSEDSSSRQWCLHSASPAAPEASLAAGMGLPKRAKVEYDENLFCVWFQF